VLVAVSLAAYWNSFGGAFVFDDDYRIVDNPLIRRWPRGISSPIARVRLSTSRWPSTTRSNGLNVTGFHAVNLTIHLLAGLALYGIVRRMLGSDRLRARYGWAAPWLAGGLRRDLAVTPAPDTERDLHRPAGRVVDGIVLSAHALLCDPWIRLAASGLVVRRVDRRSARSAWPPRRSW
jgi:hypothetical protein